MIITPTIKVLADVNKERQRQDGKWGVQNHWPEKWIVILGEEFGEVCKASLEGNDDSYRKELIHAAAVAVAAVETFDRARAK